MFCCKPPLIFKWKREFSLGPLCICLLVLLLTFLLGACNRETVLQIDNVGTDASGPNQAADITGTVRDAEGNPIVGAFVLTIPFSRDKEIDDTGREIIEQFWTDEQGSFLIPDHSQGSYNLNAFAGGFSKGVRAIGPVDFLPANLVDGAVVKSFVLTPNPIPDGGAPLPVALYDIEDKKRMSEILVTHAIAFDNLIDRIEQLSITRYRVFIIGHEATRYSEFNVLIEEAARISQFVRDGGHVVVGQLNDKTVEATPMPIFSEVEHRFALHTEQAPFNDFTDGRVVDENHPLVQGVTFENWAFIEFGQQQVKNNVVFDAAIRASFQGPNWHQIVTTPLADFVSGNGTVPAESDTIIAEFIDPVSGGSILVNQAAYYQGTFGDLADLQAIRLTQNFVQYLRARNSP